MDTHKYCIGLTGNIASGKSTVAKLFKNHGINIISADAISKNLTTLNSDASKTIIKHFGASAQQSDGNIDRKYLRHLISNSIEAKEWLENCLHPRIRQEISKALAESKSKYSVIEIPLLTNLNDHPYINRVLVIIADLDTQVQRIIARDHCTALEAKAIIDNQPTIEARLLLADDVIYNNGTKLILELEVEKLHEIYLKGAL